MATEVTSPMAGKIISVEVNKGDEVGEDDSIVLLEAMKMEMPIPTPVSGWVREICVEPGQAVEAGAIVAMISA